MNDYELFLRALGKFIQIWSPVLLFGIYLLIKLDKGEKECEKRRQAIKRTERSERKVA